MDASVHHKTLDIDPGALEPGPARGAVGRFGEGLAALHLTHDDGYELVARNWRLAVDDLRGELDIVALDPHDGCVVVCEVKTRRSAHQFGGAVSGLGPRQHARLRRMAAAFVRDVSLPYRRVRIDVIAIDLAAQSTLTHLVGVW